MVTENESDAILAAIDGSPLHGKPLRQFAMELLDRLPDYDWSGVYLLDGDTLVLDAYVGAATDHTRISVGRGVCGTAVAEERNQIVSDVRELTNYLSCSSSTRSEIVVLIRRDGWIVGQIDIDGHRVGAFGNSDEDLLRDIARRLADRWDEA